MHLLNYTFFIFIKTYISLLEYFYYNFKKYKLAKQFNKKFDKVYIDLNISVN